MINNLDFWPYSAILQIGGTEFLGFDRESNLLLVCSSAGRGVVDCRYPKVIARDDREYSTKEAKAEGIGPLANNNINVIGYDYFDSPYERSPIIQSTENWEILFDARGSIFIKRRNENSLEKATCIAKRDNITSLAACCLSPSEQYLVIAYRSEFTLFAKPNSFVDSSLYHFQNSDNIYSRVRYTDFDPRIKNANAHRNKIDEK
jgi:hypothetical protein